MMKLETITEQGRFASPTITPQALAWDGRQLWMSSRDLGRIYRIDVENWKAMEEIEPPGIAWAAVATNGALHFTIGEGVNDDRYVYRYTSAEGFTKLFACPEFTGSYLSFDGQHLYLSQWYKERILKIDERGNILHEINVGAEICGHVFVEPFIYVLRGREEPDEEWRIARFDPVESSTKIEDLASLPFASRSLTFDGRQFWSNHRAANETISFSIPGQP